MDLVFHMAHPVMTLLFCLHPAYIYKKHIKHNSHHMQGFSMTAWVGGRKKHLLAVIIVYKWVGSINNLKKLTPPSRSEQFVQSLYIERFMFEQAFPGNILTNGIISDSLSDKGQR